MPDYPIPKCGVCGYPLRFDSKSKRWYCDLCKAYPKKFMEPIGDKFIREEDPSKPKGRWWKILIFILIMLLLGGLRLFLRWS